MTDYFPQDEFDAFLKEDAQAQLRSSFEQAKGVNPDAHAKVLSLSEKSGLPVDTVERNTQKVEEDVNDLTGDHVRELFYQNMQTQAAAARHSKLTRDLDPTWWGSWKNTLTSLPELVEGGDSNLKKSKLYAKKNFGSLTPEETAELNALRMTEVAQPEIDYGSPIQTGLQSFAQSLAGMGSSYMTGATVAAPIVGVGAARGAVAGGVGGNLSGIGLVLPEEVVTVPAGAAFGALASAPLARKGFSAGVAYDNFLQMSGQLREELENIKGKNGEALPEEVLVGASIAGGVVNAGLESVFEERLLKALPGAANIKKPFNKQGIKQVLKLPGAQAVFYKFGKEVAKIAATGGITEGLQELTNISAEELSKQVSDGEFKPIDFADAAERVAQNTFAGATAGSVAGSVFAAPQAVGDYRNRDVRTPEKLKAYAENLNQSVRENKLFQRSPTAFRDITESMAGDEKLYINKSAAFEAVNSLSEEQQTALFNADPALREELQTASHTGIDVAIKKADYATFIAPFPQADQLSEHIKLDPSDTSVAERRSIQEALTANPELADGFKAPSAQIDPNVLSSLERQVSKAISAGKTDKTDVAGLSSLYARKIARDANALGLNPVEEFNKNFLGFETTDEQGNTIKQGSNIDVLLGDISRVDEVDKKGQFVFDEQTRSAIKSFSEKMTAAGITPEQAKTMGGRAVFDQLYPQPQKMDVGGVELSLPQVGITQDANGQLSLDIPQDDGSGDVIGNYLNKDETLLQADAPAKSDLGFVSKMERVIGQKLNNSGTAEQFKQQLDAFTKAGMFKADERFWSGVDDFLDEAAKTGEKVTKEQIIQFLKAKPFRLIEYGAEGTSDDRIVIDEIHLSHFSADSEMMEPDDDYIRENAKEYFLEEYLNELTEENESLPEEEQRTEEEIKNEAEQKAFDRALQDYENDPYNQVTDYYNTVEINGEDVELRIQSRYDGDFTEYSVGNGNFSEARSVDDALDEIRRELMEDYGVVFEDGYEGSEDAKFEEYTGDGGTNYRFFRLGTDELKGGSYQNTSHYNEKNVVLHMRTKDRLGPNGEKMLFVEEIQSDLHQAAYKNKIKGGFAYKTDVTPEMAEELAVQSKAAMDKEDEALKKRQEMDSKAAQEIEKETQGLDRDAVSHIMDMVLDYIRDRHAQAKDARGFMNTKAMYDKGMEEQETDKITDNQWMTIRRGIAWVASEFGSIRDVQEYAATVDRWADYKISILRDDDTETKELYDFAREWMKSQPEPKTISAEEVQAVVDKYAEKYGTEYTEINKAISDASRESSDIRLKMDALKKAPPLAPFAKTWREVAFKRLLSRAADEGYKSIGWTIGSQQNVRYNLSNFISSMNAMQNEDGTYTLLSASSNVLDAIRQAAGIESYTRREVTLTDEQLELALGKEGADSIRTQTVKGEDSKSIDFAKDIEMGGERKGNLYDAMLPQEASKILKKLDPTIKVGEIDYSIVERGRDMGKIWYAPLTEKALSESEQGFELFQRERGSISFLKNAMGDRLKRVIVSFTKAANLSTGAHEFAHFGVAMHRKYAKLAAQKIAAGEGNADMQRIVDDWEELKKAVGATSDSFSVDQEEQVARMFEGYLRNGEAPSEKLRNVFTRFREWLVAIYSDAKIAGVEVTPEVSAVFDRWLASEQEIEAVRSKHSALGELAASLNLEGEVAARLKNYIDGVKSVAEDKLYREMEREQRRQESKAYKEEFEKERVKVEAELRQKREYNLLDYMQKNGLSFIAGPETTGLPEDMVSNATGESVVHPDVVADLFGYDTGKQMLTALRATPQFDGAVNRETRTRLRAQFPNMIEDGRIHSEAISAIMNDKTLLALDLMVKEIGKAKGSANKDGIKLYAKAVAQEQTRKMLAKDAGQGYRFDVAREKAMREALKASRQGKPDEAIRHLYNAMVNQMIYKNLEAFSDLKDRAETLFKKVTDGDKELAKRADMDFIGAARYILHKYGLGGEDFDAQQWLADVKEKDPLLQQDLAGAIDAIEAPRKPAKELSISEYRQIHNAIKNIYAAARGLKEFEREEKKFQTEQVVQEMVEQFNKHKKMSVNLSTQDTTLNKFRRGLLSAKAATRRVELWTEAIDGGTDGPVKKWLWSAINKAEDALAVSRRKWNGGLLDIFKENKAVFEQTQKIDSGMTTSYQGEQAPLIFQDKLEMIGFLLHTGNQSNLDKLLGGYGISIQQFREGITRLEESGAITAQDWKLVQSLWNYVSGLLPQAQSAHRKKYGYRFDEIEPTPVQSKHGVFSGGYWPATVDTTKITDPAQLERIIAGETQFMLPTVSNGMLKSRVENYKAPLSTDLRLASQHIDKMLRFIYLDAPVTDTANLLRNPSLRAAIHAIDTEVQGSMLVPYLQRVAQQTTSTIDVTGDKSSAMVKSMFQFMRSSAVRQLMLYNPIVAIQNIANMPVVGHLVGYRNLARAFAKVTLNPSVVRDVEAASKMMEERNTIESLKIAQELNQIAGRKGGFAKGRDFMVRHGTIFMRVMDMYLSTVTWQAGYDNAIKDGKTDQQAIEAADSIVRKAQGARGPKDISNLEASHPAVQFLMPFYGYFNSQLNLQQTEFGNIMRKYGWAGTPKMFMAYISLFAATSILGELIVGSLRDKLPEDDDEDGEVLDDWMAWATRSQLRFLAAEIPIAGQVGNMFINHLNKNPMDDRLSASPAYSILEGSGRLAKNLAKEVGDEDADDSRMVQDALMTLGFATGLPLGQFGKPAGYLANINEGDEPPPSNIIDFGAGLIAGPKPKGK